MTTEQRETLEHIAGMMDMLHKGRPGNPFDYDHIAAQLRAIAAQPEAEGVVRVRIPVAVDAEGRIGAFLSSLFTEHECVQTAASHVAAPHTLSFVEASLPKPATVEGEVQR